MSNILFFSNNKESGVFDEDAQNYLDAQSIVDPTEVNATHVLFAALKEAEVYDDIIQMSLVSPKSLAATLYDAKNLVSINSAGTLIHSANGVKSNRTDGKISTGINPNNDGYDADSFGFSCYINESDDAQAQVSMSIRDTSSGFTDRLVHLIPRTGGTLQYAICDDINFDGAPRNLSNSNILGMYTLDSVNKVNTVYKNGSPINTFTFGGVDLPDLEMEWFEFHVDGGAQVIACNVSHAFLCVHLGLGATKAAALSAAVEAYQVALGRNN